MTKTPPHSLTGGPQELATIDTAHTLLTDRFLRDLKACHIPNHLCHEKTWPPCTPPKTPATVSQTLSQTLNCKLCLSAVPSSQLRPHFLRLQHCLFQHSHL